MKIKMLKHNCKKLVEFSQSYIHWEFLDHPAVLTFEYQMALPRPEKEKFKRMRNDEHRKG